MSIKRLFVLKQLYLENVQVCYGIKTQDKKPCTQIYINGLVLSNSCAAVAAADLLKRGSSFSA